MPHASHPLPLLLSRRHFIMGMGGAGACCCFLPLALTGCATSGSGSPSAGIFALSKDDEVRLGTEAWAKVHSESKVANNPQLKEMVGRVSQRIVASAGPEAAGLPWEYELFEDASANAFALPGGKIGVNTGLFNVAKNEDQLATVLGHEVRHVTGHHGAKRYEQEMMTSAGLQVVSIALGQGGVANADKVVSLLGAGTEVGLILPFSRDQESEADMAGLEYMAKAGYKPRESIAFWQNMIAAGSGSGGPTFLSTHPASSDRIANLTRKAAELEAHPPAKS